MTTRKKVNNRPERRREPTHPGLVLRAILTEEGFRIPETAKRFAVSPRSLRLVLNGKRAITPKMAAQLGIFLRNEGEVWLNMQIAHDTWRANQELRREKKLLTKTERQQLRDGARKQRSGSCVEESP